MATQADDVISYCQPQSHQELPLIVNGTPFNRLPWTTHQDESILGPYTYYSSQSGKNMRSRMIDAFNVWLNVPHDDLVIIKKVVEMLHNASLLVDDIQDSSDLRRGLPAAHIVYGVAQTINSANYVYFCALAEVMRLGNDGIVAVFVEELQNLHRGQGMELFWRDNLSCPTEGDYLTMVSNKTGGLLRLAVRLLQIRSCATVDLVPLADLMGIVYQIRDDYLNLCSIEYSKTKGLCEDLCEGKFSYPVIHSLRSQQPASCLLSIIRQRTKDPNLHSLALSCMKETHSFEYCREKLVHFGDLAKQLAADLGKRAGEDWGIQQILENLARLD